MDSIKSGDPCSFFITMYFMPSDYLVRLNVVNTEMAGYDQIEV